MNMRLTRNQKIILIALLLINLRVLFWVQPGNFIMGGDLRPPLNPAAFYTHAAELTNAVDFGVPSVYLPRLLDPFLSLTALSATVGIPVWIAEVAVIYFIYFCAMLLFYIFSKLVTGNTLIAFVAAFFFGSNLHLIVDREVSAVGFMSMALTILPSLAVFAYAVKMKNKRALIFSALLFPLTYAFFPNYKAPILCLISMALTLFFFRLDGKFELSVKKLWRPTVLFLLVILAASSWVLVYAALNWQSYSLTNASAVTEASTMFYDRPIDVLRLIAHWGFYSSAYGHPYVPYASTYLENPLVVAASFIPTVLAFFGVTAYKTRKQKEIVLIVLAISLFLTMGFTTLFAQQYFALISVLPLLAPFRAPSNWIFIPIILFSLLVGMASAKILNRFKTQRNKLLSLALILLAIVAASYPLYNGDVTRNWLNPNEKGVPLPEYFFTTDSYRTETGYMLLLPQRTTYVTYNFSTLVNFGNPYPILFAKPYISGTGTEYVQSQNSTIIKEVYSLALDKNTTSTLEFYGELGIRYLLLEKCMVLGNTTSLSNITVTNNPHLIVVHEWEEATLYYNPYS